MADRYSPAMPIDPEPPPEDPLRAEEFDALVRSMLPIVRRLRPDLSDVETLRAAAHLAEARLRDEGRLDWIVPRI
jgi:hypothetical protein